MVNGSESRTKAIILCAAMISTLFSCPPPLFAQVDEILVTATKRETTVQTTSASISAFSDEQIRLRDLDSAQDLAFSTPGLVFGQTAGTPQITIRGVGLSVDTGFAEAGVATYVNGIFLSRPDITNLAFGDLARAEVLRGPQGTLFGRNATGGAVNFITKRPTDIWTFSAAGSYSSFNTHEWEATVSGPVVEDWLSVRGYAKFKHTDGHILDLAPEGGDENVDRLNSQTFRLSILAKPLRNLEGYFTLGHVQQHAAHRSYQLSKFVGTVNPLTPEVFTVEPHRTYHDVDESGELDATIFGSTITWDIGPLQLKSVTGLTLYNDTSIADGDSRDRLQLSPLDPLGPLLPQIPFVSQLLGIPIPSPVDVSLKVTTPHDYKTTTQEISIAGKVWDRIDFVAGMFYMHESGFVRQTAVIGPGNLLSGTNVVDSRLIEENRSIAGFVDVTVSVTDWMRVLAGARYSADTKDQTQIDTGNVAPLAGFNLDGSCDATEVQTYKNFSPKLGLEFDATDQTLIYGTFQKATKPGGYNISACGDLYEEEKISAFEAGIKTTLLSGRLTISGAGFYYDYENYQIFQLVAPISSDIINAPKSHVVGAELEAFGRFWTMLDINFGLSYLNAVYDEFVGSDSTFLVGGLGASEQDLSGNRFSRAPLYSINLGAQLTIPLDTWKLGTLTLRTDLYHSAEVYFGQFNTEFERDDPYTLLNFVVAISDRTDSVQVRGFIKNVTNAEYIISQTAYTFELFSVLPGQDLRSATALGTYGPPRTFGIEISAEF